MLYNDILSEKLEALPTLDVSCVNEHSTVTRMTDEYIERVNNAMHEAAMESGCVPRRRYRPKSYWCPQLSVLRDRKRFWWHLWVENGRPNKGAV